MSDYKHKRINAFMKVAGDGWKAGTVLTSSLWKHPRSVVSVDQGGVILVGPGGRYNCTSLPSDVRVYGIRYVEKSCERCGHVPGGG